MECSARRERTSANIASIGLFAIYYAEHNKTRLASSLGLEYLFPSRNPGDVDVLCGLRYNAGLVGLWTCVRPSIPTPGASALDFGRGAGFLLEQSQDKPKRPPLRRRRIDKHNAHRKYLVRSKDD